MSFQSSLHIVGLLRKHLEGVLTVAEREELEDWVAQSGDHEALLRDVGDMDWVKEELMLLNSYDVEVGKNNVFSKIERRREEAKVRKAVVFRRGWVKYAAVLMLMLGIGVYYFFNGANSRKLQLEGVKRGGSLNVVPGGNRAVLTLVDGSTISLEGVGEGTLARQGGANVVKLGNGQLVYDRVLGVLGKDEIGYNTLSTPKGGQYQITLPDGTKVWLNAASSITYPTLFVDGKREVRISGEAYLEIAPVRLGSGGRMPFLVDVEGVKVEVLGTHFNVNAYKDESCIRASLLQGKVKVVKGIFSEVLKPGQQAVVRGKIGVDNNKIDIDSNVDMSSVMAWKEGLFNFNRADVPTVMRQLSRWYDVEVRYEGVVPVRLFQGKFQRELSFSEVLAQLGEMQLKFRLEGRVLTVLQ